MGRFLSGNVSDSFRRVQYLFRLYSLPHRAVGRKSRPRMRGQFLPLADPRWHSHTQTLRQNQSLFFLPVLLARPAVRANFTMPPLFLCWSCVCNAFCRGLCVWISVEVFVVITLEAMASARDAPCCSPQLSTRHRHAWYLSFFLHRQNFWRIKFTPKKLVNYDKIHSKLPFFFALLRQNTQ